MFRTCEDCTAWRVMACTRASACQGSPEGGPASAPAAIDVPEFELKRLDVEDGDVLVYRTRSKLTPDQAERIADRIDRHAQRHGFHDVRTIVLDDCSDLAIERPARADTRMRHQAPRPVPVITR